jgi:hypothetical protein
MGMAQDCNLNEGHGTSSFDISGWLLGVSFGLQHAVDHACVFGTLQ